MKNKRSADGEDLTDPSCFEGNDLPVECVSWYDAKQFCEELNKRSCSCSGSVIGRAFACCSVVERSRGDFYRTGRTSRTSRTGRTGRTDV